MERNTWLFLFCGSTLFIYNIGRYMYYSSRQSYIRATLLQLFHDECVSH